MSIIQRQEWFAPIVTAMPRLYKYRGWSVTIGRRHVGKGRITYYVEAENHKNPPNDRWWSQENIPDFNGAMCLAKLSIDIAQWQLSKGKDGDLAAGASMFVGGAAAEVGAKRRPVNRSNVAREIELMRRKAVREKGEWSMSVHRYFAGLPLKERLDLIDTTVEALDCGGTYAQKNPASPARRRIVDEWRRACR